MNGLTVVINICFDNQFYVFAFLLFDLGSLKSSDSSDIGDTTFDDDTEMLSELGNF